jgi:hypothetical protein
MRQRVVQEDQEEREEAQYVQLRMIKAAAIRAGRRSDRKGLFPGCCSRSQMKTGPFVV